MAEPEPGVGAWSGVAVEVAAAWWQAATIETARLVIRRARAEDFAAWRDGHARARPPQHPLDYTPRDPSERTEAHFDALRVEHDEDARRGEGYKFLIFARDDGRNLGAISLFEVARGNSQSGFLGYNIWNVEAGRGFATEAVQALVPALFAGTGLHRITAGTELPNIGSQKVLRRAGFRLEGLACRRVFQRGAWRDSLMFATTVEEWADGPPEPEPPPAAR